MYEDIKDHWDNKATSFGDSQEATHEDTYLRDMEINALINTIKKYGNKDSNLIDIGCGNAYSTFHFAKVFPRMSIEGVDYSEKMIEEADKSNEKKKFENISFKVSNVLNSEDFEENKYDLVTTERCLINLSTHEDHIKALKNIHKTLKKDGVAILSEETIQAYNNINSLRQMAGLSNMSIQWHNKYIDYDKMLNDIEGLFDVIEVNNFSSSYYLGTRLFKALFYDELGKDAGSDLQSKYNEVSSKIMAVGDFGLLKLIILRKK